MTFRELIGKLHLWLGLASGLVVFIVSLTGCVYVFQPELFSATHRSLLQVAPPPAAQPLPYTVIWQRAQQALGAQYPLVYGTAYRDPSRAWTFMAYQGQAGRPYFGGMITHYYTVYMNPYTGQATGILNNKYEFFEMVRWLHWGLWLGAAGEWLVGYCTLVFVLMLLSGLVLWWPRNKAARKQRFKIKWDASGKRLNYDLHSAAGFYVTLVSLAIALTGLTWSFAWVRNGIGYLATGRTEAPAASAPTAPPRALRPAELQQVAQRLDQAVRETWQRVPAAASLAATPVTTAATPLVVRVNERLTTYYRTDQLTFDARTGALQKLELYRDKPAGEQFVGMNYDIHVGAILGWPTKVLAFVASLLCATLPVTGFFVWWNRLRRNKKPHRQPAAARIALPA